MTKNERHWKLRVVEATKGNTTLLGTVVIALFGRMARRPPWIGKRATIMPEGHITAPMMSRNGRQGQATIFESVEDMTTQFSRLADDLKLDDEERIALFKEVKLWCYYDLRPKKENLIFHARNK